MITSHPKRGVAERAPLQDLFPFLKKFEKTLILQAEDLRSSNASRESN